MLHTRLYFLFVFVFPKMEAPNFESIFECISDVVNKVLVLVLVLVRPIIRSWLVLLYLILIFRVCFTTNRDLQFQTRISSHYTHLYKTAGREIKTLHYRLKKVKACFFIKCSGQSVRPSKALHASTMTDLFIPTSTRLLWEAY